MMIQVIQAAADQRETLGGEIAHRRGKIQFTVEPGFNGVPI
jgi:hypothetical protein